HIVFAFALLLAGIYNTASAQHIDECKWTYSVKVTGEDEAVLTFKATVKDGWHLYSQKYTLNPLIFTFESNSNYSLSGKVIEPTPKTVYDDIMQDNLVYFESHTVKFTQKIKLKTKEPFEIRGKMTGQACMDEGQCKVFQEAPFLFKIDPNQLTQEN